MKGEVDIMVNFPIDTFLKTIAHSDGKGSPPQIHAGGIWALPVRVGGSRPLPGWFGALF